MYCFYLGDTYHLVVLHRAKPWSKLSESHLFLSPSVLCWEYHVAKNFGATLIKVPPKVKQNVACYHKTLENERRVWAGAIGRTPVVFAVLLIEATRKVNSRDYSGMVFPIMVASLLHTISLVSLPPLLNGLRIFSCGIGESLKLNNNPSPLVERHVIDW